MSFFGGGTITVASSIYNLAGPAAKRPDFLATTVVSDVLSPISGKDSMGETIVDALMKGPATDHRRFYQWSKTNFSIGLPQAQAQLNRSTLGIDFTPYLPPGAVVVSAIMDGANARYWAERWILENRPDDFDTAWSFDQTSPLIIRVTFEDATTADAALSNFSQLSDYFYVTYYTVSPSLPQLWIYRIGSGTAVLDALADTEVILNEFYPFIPLRLDNKSIRHTDYIDTIFGQCRKAYKKATGGIRHIEDLLDQIEENPDIGDIDYCFLVHGVPFNAPDRASKTYIYEFFKGLIPYQTANEDAFQAWLARAQVDPDVEEPPSSSLRLHSGQAVTASFDMRIVWGNITETVHAGLYKPGARKGDAWIETGLGVAYIGGFLDRILITHQVSASSYRQLSILGLVHINHVYSGQLVKIHAREALTDDEESGFIIPMHFPTVQKLSLVRATQLSVSNAILVFNSYEEKKKKWYQTGFFGALVTIVLAIVIAVVTYFFPPGGVAIAGVLGTNAAVGAAFGLTGLSAAIAGAVANAVVSMIIMRLLTTLATSVFGEQFGQIIGILASAIAITAATNYSVTGSFFPDWGELMRAENLIKITDAVSGVAKGVIQGKVTDIAEDIVQLGEDYDAQIDEIDRRTAELLGYSGVLLNPLMYAQLDSSALRAESSSTFLSRTLLTGSDIAEVSNSLIDDFPRISLELPKYTL